MESMSVMVGECEVWYEIRHRKMAQRERERENDRSEKWRTEG